MSFVILADKRSKNVINLLTNYKMHNIINKGRTLPPFETAGSSASAPSPTPRFPSRSAQFSGAGKLKKKPTVKLIDTQDTKSSILNSETS